MAETRFDLHAMRYGDIIRADLEGTEYDGAQCSECPSNHRCCDLIVVGTPAEAAGILQWLSLNSKDVAAVARAVQFRVTILQEHFRKYRKDIAKGIDAWFDKKLKCVFYDKVEKKCSIYPVRPVACSRAYGAGDCLKDGIKSMPESKEVLTARAARFKIHPDLQQNVAEITSLVAQMSLDLNSKVEVDNAFFNSDPLKLTDEQVIFGLGSQTRNPVSLEALNGRSIRPRHPVSDQG